MVSGANNLCMSGLDHVDCKFRLSLSLSPKSFPNEQEQQEVETKQQWVGGRSYPLFSFDKKSRF